MQGLMEAPTETPAPEKHTRSRLWWVVGGAVLTVLAIGFTGASVIFVLLHNYQTTDEVRTFHQPISVLEVTANSADVTVHAGAPGEVRVDSHLRWWRDKPEPELAWNGSTLRMQTGCDDEGLGLLHWTCDVHEDITVPADVQVRITGATGDLTARGMTGPVTLAASTGDVIVGGATGQVSARSNTGDVSVQGVTSPTVDAESNTGDVTVSCTTPPTLVTATTNTGDVAVVVPGGTTYAVTAQTDTGDRNVTVDQDSSAPRRIDTRTDTGDVRVTNG